MLEATSINAGETVTWSASFPDYPASAGWVAKYYFAGATAKNVTGVANGNAFDFTLTATETAALGSTTDRLYSYICQVSLSSVVHNTDAGTVIVKPNIATAAAGYDGRSHARATLALIEDAIANWAANPYRVMQIAGRTQEWSLQELLKLRGTYRSEVRIEEAKERVAKGLSPGNRMLIQFK